MTCTRTQGAQLVAALKRQPHTYMQMLRLGLSTSPWKRVAETLDMRPDLTLVKGKRKGDGLVTWRVVKA